MLWSYTSPDVNTSKIPCLKPNTIALLRKAMKKKQVSFKKEVGVMVNDLVFWLTVCLILKMCY